jgi:hypothetical protein
VAVAVARATETEAETREVFTEACAKARTARVTAAKARKERATGVLVPTAKSTMSAPPFTKVDTVGPSEEKKAVTKKADMARLIMKVHGAPPCGVESTIFGRVEKRVYDAIKRGDITLPCSEDIAEKWAKTLTFRVSLNPDEDLFEV